MIRGALLAASVAAALRLPAPATAQQQHFPTLNVLIQTTFVCKASCAGPPPTSVIGFNEPITLYGYTQVVGTFYDSDLPQRFGGAIVPSDVGCKSPLSQVLCQGERSDGQRPGGRSVYRCRPSVCNVHTRTLAHHLAHPVLGPLRVCYLLRRS